jgi:hypothetical protein
MDVKTKPCATRQAECFGGLPDAEHEMVCVIPREREHVAWLGRGSQHALRQPTEFRICRRRRGVVELPEVERVVLEMLCDETNDIRRKAFGELVLNDVA